MMEITEEEWSAAIEHLRIMENAYSDLPVASGWFGTGIIRNLRARCESGERTKKLYDEILAIE